MNDDGFSNLREFQRIWMENLSKWAASGGGLSPDNPPPEAARSLRDGLFQAMGEMWEHYLRSPEFLDATKNSMDNAVAFRKLTNEFFERWRETTQTPGQNDLQQLLQAVQSMEKNLAGRLEQLERRLAALESAPRSPRGASPTTPSPRPRPRKKSTRATSNKSQ